MTIPHSPWARYYDQVYEKSFGYSYKELTKKTLKQIQDVLPPPRDLVDFGAGTGRLAIPLLSLGYNVTAVEPCEEMVLELKKKDINNKIKCHILRMADLEITEQFDFATCVFTVLIYLLDEDALNKSIKAAYNSLRPDGYFLVDIPTIHVFSHMNISNKHLSRSIRVEHKKDDVYQFSEATQIKVDGETVEINDTFPIRYWPREVVCSMLKDVGFVSFKDVSDLFKGTGSNYLLLRKPPRKSLAGND